MHISAFCTLGVHPRRTLGGPSSVGASGVSIGIDAHIWTGVQDMSGQIVAYARVSSIEQNPGRQLAAIGQVEETFTDRSSGKSRTDRLALTEMLRHVRRGDTVRVASMDRLARSVVDLAQIIQELNGRGATVEFLTERLSFTPEQKTPSPRSNCTCSAPSPNSNAPSSGSDSAKASTSPAPTASTKGVPASSPASRSPRPCAWPRPGYPRPKSPGLSDARAECSTTRWSAGVPRRHPQLRAPPHSEPRQPAQTRAISPGAGDLVGDDVACVDPNAAPRFKLRAVSWSALERVRIPGSSWCVTPLLGSVIDVAVVRVIAGQPVRLTLPGSFSLSPFPPTEVLYVQLHGQKHTARSGRLATGAACVVD